jgi:hypothetical protein
MSALIRGRAHQHPARALTLAAAAAVGQGPKTLDQILELSLLEAMKGQLGGMCPLFALVLAILTLQALVVRLGSRDRGEHLIEGVL